jgi:hypothetical protein
MNDYQQKVIADYTRALRKAERLLKEAEQGVWNTKCSHLYDISTDLRSALYRISEEMDQMVFDAQKSEGD